MKENLKSGILERIKLHYNLSTNSEVAAFLGTTPQTVSNWISRNSIDYDLIFTKCVGVDLNWLISGKDEFLSNKKETPDKPILKKPQNPKQKPQIETPDIENGGLVVPIVGKSFERRVERQEVPLYDFDAVAGLTPVFNGQGNPVDYISIPNLAKVDGAVPICGDSMYPLLKSGDIVMYKIVNDFTNIIWGEMYLISISYDDDEYISVKYLRKSENSQKNVILASYNPNHAPKEIPIECIRSLALIKAVIHFNVM